MMIKNIFYSDIKKINILDSKREVKKRKNKPNSKNILLIDL